MGAAPRGAGRKRVAAVTVVYPEKRVLCEHHETPVPEGLPQAGEVLPAEAVRYELFEENVVREEIASGGGRFFREQVLYDVHESSPSTLEEPDPYVARYEGFTPQRVVLTFPALSNHVFKRFPLLDERPRNRF